MTAYYNENDPYAAQWLRNLIAAGHIAPGEVDDRSIADVTHTELAAFDQCHFFAGIGGWSFALRLAGWPDDQPVWTGSCPCQPFSAAGKQRGMSDERHLWPVWFNLIRQCAPDVIFGEQVESAVRHGWLDGVCADLEGEGYAVGATVLGAHSVGAPHIRQRLWWVADANQGQRGRIADGEEREFYRAPTGWQQSNGIAEPSRSRVEHADSGRSSPRQQTTTAVGHRRSAEPTSSGLADDDDARLEGWPLLPERRDERAAGPHSVGLQHSASNGRKQRRSESGQWGAEFRRGADGKLRRIEPSVQPLAHGVSNRVGRLRAYGNAIVPQVAAEFITAFREAQP